MPADMNFAESLFCFNKQLTTVDEGSLIEVFDNVCVSGVARGGGASKFPACRQQWKGGNEFCPTSSRNTCHVIYESSPPRLAYYRGGCVY